jgi:hypothetical protein
MYYRVAFQRDHLLPWQWKSTALSSLNILLHWLQYYRAFPHDRLRIFSSSSREDLNEQLVRENQGRGSTSVLATQFLQEGMIRSPEVARRISELEGGAYQKKVSIAVASQPSSSEIDRGVNALDGRDMSSLERRRLELEDGSGGDHDLPYRFTLPTSLPQVLAWMKLLTKMQEGKL